MNIHNLTMTIREKAVVSIRSLINDEEATIAHRIVAPNPYKSNENDTIDIFNINESHEAWTDSRDGHLFQYGPNSRVAYSPNGFEEKDRLPVSELRQKALKIVASQIEDFESRRSSFHPLEDNRQKQTYFFRWDDFSQPAKEDELPPFVQVGLRADGRLASFTNSLTPTGLEQSMTKKKSKAKAKA